VGPREVAPAAAAAQQTLQRLRRTGALVLSLVVHQRPCGHAHFGPQVWPGSVFRWPKAPEQKGGQEAAAAQQREYGV